MRFEVVQQPLIAFVGLGLACAVLSARAEVRVADGGAAIPIAVPELTKPVHHTAARELCEYLKRVTGCSFKTVPEASVTGPAIYLGATKFAEEKGLGLASCCPEEWFVKEFDGSLVIAGGEPRGTLYAVYHFLEDAVGVRWLSPAPDGDYVPSRPNLVLEDLDLHGNPPMPYRSIYTVPNGTKFLARNRMNTGSVEYGGGWVYGGTQESHTLYSTLGTPDEVRTLFKEHPEYFPLKDGKRYCDLRKCDGGSQSQLCLTNPELRKLWSDKLRALVVKETEKRKAAGTSMPLFYAVDQNDCFDGFCQCESCQAIVRREESNSGLMLDFANYVAEQLEDVLGESKIQMMALHSTEKPPKILKARKNVSVRLCDTTSNVLKPWTDPENAKHLDNLRTWTQHTDFIEMWDYSVTYGSPVNINYPTATEKTFATDLRTLLENKGDGIFFEHENPLSADMRDLKVWVEIKLAENPLLDGEKLIREFARLYYGAKAGEKVLEYRTFLAARGHAAKARVIWFPSVKDYAFIDAATFERIYEIYGEAFAAGENDTARTRVDHAFLSADRLYILRAQTLQRENEAAGGKHRLPDPEAVTKRYCATLERESEARGFGKKNKELDREIGKFFKMVKARRELPIPEVFKAYPANSVSMYSATLMQTYFEPNKIVEDKESVPGMVLRVAIADVKKQLKFDLDAYTYPFKWVVWPTMKGTKRGTVVDPPKAKPDGYHWYKCAEDLLLTQESRFAVFAGCNILLEGAVSDNSELGQKYDIWMSVKVDGPDYFAAGAVTDETVIYVDQFAAIRKTTHGSVR